MEIPENLKSLYRHWSGHTGQAAGTFAFVDKELFEQMSWFIRERLSVWEAKTVGKEPPYTDDPILSRYRFCNIFREFDRQTIEFHQLLNPLRDDFPLWLLNMFYARLVARPQTVRAVGLLSFDAGENAALYERLMASPRPRYGTPYVFPVSVIQRSQTPTRERFIAEYLPQAMRAVAGEIEGWEGMSVYDGVERVLPIFGFNLRFLWTEVLIDVAYQYPEHIDLFGRFPVGPGSVPTFARIDAGMDPSELASVLATINLDTGLTYQGQPLRLSAENWEGIGCEFRKYTNLKAGKGRKRVFGPRPPAKKANK